MEKPFQFAKTPIQRRLVILKERLKSLSQSRKAVSQADYLSGNTDRERQAELGQINLLLAFELLNKFLGELLHQISIVVTNGPGRKKACRLLALQLVFLAILIQDWSIRYLWRAYYHFRAEAGLYCIRTAQNVSHGFKAAYMPHTRLIPLNRCTRKFGIAGSFLPRPRAVINRA